MTDKMNRAKDLYRWIERVFVVLGVWPLKSAYLTFAVSCTYLAIHIIMEMIDLVGAFGNIELMVLNLSESALEIMIIVKMIALRFSRTMRKLMRNIIDSVDEQFLDCHEEIEIYLRYNRTAKMFAAVWIAMGSSSAITYHLKPLEFRLRAVLFNESTPYVLPYRTQFFFEVNDSARFWLVWIYQCPMVYIHSFHSATIAHLFSLVLHVCGQLSVLTFRIKNLDFNARTNDETSGSIFRDIVNRHQKILGLANGIESVFHLLLLEELLALTVVLGLVSYIVIVNRAEDTGVFVSCLMFGMTILLLIYGYCVAGEYLIVESTNLYEAYYQCRWYDLSTSFKKQLIICMIYASKPIQLTGGGFYVFSLFSFTSILKTSASCISMLRTII